MESSRKASARILLSAALVAAGIAAAGFGVAAAVRACQPSVTERWTAYVESLKPESRLVVLSSRQRYAGSREFTSKLLAVLKIKASIELSAWADVSYFIDLADPSAWSADWDRKSRRLTLKVPSLKFLPPAVRTETIEIRSKGANLVTNTVFRLKEEAARMRDELSADLSARVGATLGEPGVVSGAREGIAGFGRAFCRSALKSEASEVVVLFPGE